MTATPSHTPSHFSDPDDTDSSTLRLPTPILERAEFRFRWLGTQPYASGLKAQSLALENLRAGLGRGDILALEHTSVVTLGKRGQPELDLYATPEELKARGFDLVTTERGGQATLHSPGQLVIYPCVSLAQARLGVRAFVKHLEAATQAFLTDVGIQAAPAPDEPGLYTAQGKIAFFGLRVTHGFTSHGLAINVSNDVKDFALIRSCGKSQETFDRLQDHGVTAPLSELFLRWIPHFLDGLS